MTDLKHYYGAAEGPLGFPLSDKQAFALEAVLKALPRDSAFNYRTKICASGTGVSPVPLTSEVLANERSDVSWISTEDPDRMGEVVSAKGMSDSQFRLNPIVTLNHCYDMPPVGKSLWRKFVRGRGRESAKAHEKTRNNDFVSLSCDFVDATGIKAKTQYPARPADWTENKDWPADVAFSLVQADLLRGKSIGFLPVKVHTPTTREIEQWASRTGVTPVPPAGVGAASRAAPQAPLGSRGLLPLSDRSTSAHGESPVVNLVIDEWILLEYACVFLPAQQNAVVESVSKGLVIPQEFQKALGIGEDRRTGVTPVPPNSGSLMAQKRFDPRSSNLAGGTGVTPVLPFTRLSEIEKAIQRQIEAIDLAAACRSRLDERLDLLRGRI